MNNPESQLPGTRIRWNGKNLYERVSTYGVHPRSVVSGVRRPPDRIGGVKVEWRNARWKGKCTRATPSDWSTKPERAKQMPVAEWLGRSPFRSKTEASKRWGLPVGTQSLPSNVSPCFISSGSAKLLRALQVSSYGSFRCHLGSIVPSWCVAHYRFIPTGSQFVYLLPCPVHFRWLRLRNGRLCLIRPRLKIRCCLNLLAVDSFCIKLISYVRDCWLALTEDELPGTSCKKNQTKRLASMQRLNWNNLINLGTWRNQTSHAEAPPSSFEKEEPGCALQPTGMR